MVILDGHLRQYDPERIRFHIVIRHKSCRPLVFHQIDINFVVLTPGSMIEKMVLSTAVSNKSFKMSTTKSESYKVLKL